MYTLLRTHTEITCACCMAQCLHWQVEWDHDNNTYSCVDKTASHREMLCTAEEGCDGAYESGHDGLNCNEKCAPGFHPDKCYCDNRPRTAITLANLFPSSAQGIGSTRTFVFDHTTYTVSLDAACTDT
jgi:hypothetical protein